MEKNRRRSICRRKRRLCHFSGVTISEVLTAEGTPIIHAVYMREEFKFSKTAWFRPPDVTIEPSDPLEAAMNILEAAFHCIVIVFSVLFPTQDIFSVLHGWYI